MSYECCGVYRTHSRGLSWRAFAVSNPWLVTMNDAGECSKALILANFVVGASRLSTFLTLTQQSIYGCQTGITSKFL